jgi:hypothetical protein
LKIFQVIFTLIIPVAQNPVKKVCLSRRTYIECHLLLNPFVFASWLSAGSPLVHYPYFKYTY